MSPALAARSCASSARSCASSARNRAPPPGRAVAHRGALASTRATSADDDGARDEPSTVEPTRRRVARRTPRVESGAKAAAVEPSAETEAPRKVRKVRKLSASVKQGAKTRQVISADRREREAAALEKFLKKKDKLLVNASVGTASQVIASALTEETTTHEGGGICWRAIATTVC